MARPLHLALRHYVNPLTGKPVYGLLLSGKEIGLAWYDSRGLCIDFFEPGFQTLSAEFHSMVLAQQQRAS